MKIHFFKHSTQLLATILFTLGIGIEGTAFAQGDESLEEITVTGSRILRRDFTSLSPIVTIDTDTFENRVNIGIESALNQLPQFTVAGTQAQNSSAASPFPAADAAPGCARLPATPAGGAPDGAGRNL